MIPRLDGINAQKWPHAMNAKYNSLLENQALTDVTTFVNQNYICLLRIKNLKEEQFSDERENKIDSKADRSWDLSN